MANFLMFTVSEENTVKCLEGSSDIFGNGRTSSLVFRNLRQYCGLFYNLFVKIASSERQPRLSDKTHNFQFFCGLRLAN